MFSNRSSVGPLVTFSAMLTVAAMLPGFVVHGQDFGKTYQVEVPVINLLKQKPNAAKPEEDAAASKSDTQISAEKPLTPDQPSRLKHIIELPTESLLGESDVLRLVLERNDEQPLITDANENSKVLPADNRFISKGDIELPTEQLIDLGRTVADIAVKHEDVRAAEPEAKLKATPDNPNVKPGLVDWHADLTTASLQSKISGKPVLHFQLLGELDQRFT